MLWQLGVLPVCGRITTRFEWGQGWIHGGYLLMLTSCCIHQEVSSGYLNAAFLHGGCDTWKITID